MQRAALDTENPPVQWSRAAAPALASGFLGPRLCVHLTKALGGGNMLSFGRILNWESDGLDFSTNPALSLLSNLE